MSDSSNDAELSGGWAIISNEGSDIETLGSEAAVENGAELSDRPLVEETRLQDTQDIAPAACVDEDSLNEMEERTVDETLFVPEDRDFPGAEGKEPATVCSLSDGSDILTLGDLKEDEHADAEEEEEEKETSGNEDLYLGMSCSSQYAFIAADTVFPAQQAAVMNSSSSSDDEAGQSPNTVLRRRRVRKNTPTCVATEPEDEESSPGDDVGEEEVEEEEVEEEEVEEEVEVEEVEEEEVGDAEVEEVEDGEVEEEMMEKERQQQNEETEVGPAQSQGGGLLNKCILLALVVAFSMSFGHFHGVKQIEERRKVMETFRTTELDGVRDLLQRHIRGKYPVNQDGYLDLTNLDELQVVLLLTTVIEKMNKENQVYYVQQIYTQAEMNDLKELLQQTTEEKAHMAAQNQQLKNVLERDERSVYMLQQQLQNLHSELNHLRTMEDRADLLTSENQRLNQQLEEKTQLILDSQVQNEGLTAEVKLLRTKLEKRRKVMLELRSMLNSLRSSSAQAGKEAGQETEELHSRLMELETRLSFEQQRSDLWERLYVETKEEQAKGESK